MNTSQAQYSTPQRVPVAPAQEQEIRRCLRGLMSLLADLVAHDIVGRAGEAADISDTPPKPAFGAKKTAPQDSPRDVQRQAVG